MAVTYHDLGNTALLRAQLDEAEEGLDEAEHWYSKSLTTKEVLGIRPTMASTYAQLGAIAKDRGRLDEAEEWYRKSLAISEELGDRPTTGLACAALGLLAEDQAQVSLALAWNLRCVTLFDEFPSPLTVDGAGALARLTRQLGMPALEAAWQQATGQPVPQPVRDVITSIVDQDQAGDTP
jgi:tetratricopeptide (TPR) repeat protein